MTRSDSETARSTISTATSAAKKKKTGVQRVGSKKHAKFDLIAVLKIGRNENVKGEKDIDSMGRYLFGMERGLEGEEEWEKLELEELELCKQKLELYIQELKLSAANSKLDAANLELDAAKTKLVMDAIKGSRS